MAATVTVVADFAVYDGYGSMNLYLVRGLHRAGARVSVVPLGADIRGCPPDFVGLLGRARSRMDGPVLCSSWMVRPELSCFTGAELFLRTMVEGSGIPTSWPDQLDHVRGFIVPSAFVADVFHRGGLTAPIAVVPDGVDPDVYRYEPRPQRDSMTTLMVGALQPRKHYRQGVAAWKRVFGEDPGARLIIKSRMGHHDGFVADDPRIHVDIDNDRSHGIAHWYRQADVLMALGSEGFGLPLIEGMATGLPVIALDSEGQADVCRDAGDLVLKVRPKRWEPNPTTDGSMVCGVRGVPDANDVAAQLRWVAEHRDEAADLGRAASAWVHRHRNVWNYGPDVLSVMEEHTRTRRPLRRRRRRGPGRSVLAALSPSNHPATTPNGVRRWGV